MPVSTNNDGHAPVAVPPIVDQRTWEAALDELRAQEKAATRQLDAIAAARRRLPMVELPDYTLEGADGPVRLADVFDGTHQLIVYHHMWFPGEEWQCPGCTGFTSQFTRLEFLEGYDARFVIVTQGPIDEALAYRERVGNKMTWYSSAGSPFATDMGAPPGGGFQVNVFLRVGDTVYRTYNTQGRGTEQLSHTFPLIDLLPYGRQEEWQDSPTGGRNRRRTRGGRARRSTPSTPMAADPPHGERRRRLGRVVRNDVRAALRVGPAPGGGAGEGRRQARGARQRPRPAARRARLRPADPDVRGPPPAVRLVSMPPGADITSADDLVPLDGMPRQMARTFADRPTHPDVRPGPAVRRAPGHRVGRPGHARHGRRHRGVPRRRAALELGGGTQRRQVVSDNGPVTIFRGGRSLSLSSAT